MSAITDEIRAQASEMYRGDEICQVKSKFLLTEMNLPNGLLPLKNIEECGYIEKTGFVWLIQKEKCDHRFEKIDRPVKYAREVTAYVEKNKIKKLTGVKTKELLLWVSLCDIYVDDPPTGKITFKTPTGLFRTFPVSAFEVDVPVEPVKEEVEEKKEEVNDDDTLAKELKEKVQVVNGGADVEVKEKKVAEVAPALATVGVKDV